MNDSQQTEFSTPTEARWAKYICNYENNVLSQLSPQWLLATHALGNTCAHVLDFPQGHCGDNRKGTLFP